MPRPYTFPTLFDSVCQINIQYLKKIGYLKENSICNGALIWSSRGNKTGSINISVNTLTEEPFAKLEYKYKEEDISYRVKLTTLPSNLNKGRIWYFICPQTNKRCRKLYLIGKYFFHRDAFVGAMYYSQTHSKFHQSLVAFHKIDLLKEKLNAKYFKEHYAGKQTKKYISLMEQTIKLNKRIQKIIV